MAHISPDAPSVLRSSRLRTLIRIWLLEPTMRKLPRQGRMLDLCCGYGFYLRMNPQASGIDGDPACVEALREEGRDVKLANVLERFPYDDEAFDYVVAHDVLEHFVFEELETLVAEVHRVLVPGGTFVVWVPNRKGFDAGIDPAVGHRLYVTRAEMQKLASAGFTIVEEHAEPLPRALGRHFTHNKEVFSLRKSI
jgi:SAM-dependent methyltransferase